MPQIQVLPDNQRGRGNVLEALGKGLGEGIADLSQRSLAQKMDLLKQQKQMDMQRQYVSQYAQKLRKLGGDFVPFADAYEATGGNETLAKMFVEYGLGGGQQSPRQAASEGYGMGPMKQPQPFQPGQMEETIPIQDREAVEDIAPMAQAPKVPGMTREQDPRTIEDYKYKIAPNYDRLRGPAKEKVDRSAEREFNAATALRKEELGREKFEYEKGAPIRARLAKEQERVDSLRSGIRRKMAAQEEMGRIISSGEISGVMPWLIDKFGINPLMKPESSAFKVALKENFLGNIGRVGSRPNMWIEQQLMEMAPAIGRSEEANLLALEALKGDTAVDQKEIQLMDELSNKYPDDPDKILKEKNRLLDDFALEQQKKTSYNMQSVKEQIQKKNDPKAFNSLRKVTPGTPLTVEKKKVILDAFKGDKRKAIDAAKQLGYEIVYMPGE